MLRVSLSIFNPVICLLNLIIHNFTFFFQYDSHRFLFFCVPLNTLQIYESFINYKLKLNN